MAEDAPLLPVARALPRLVFGGAPADPPERLLPDEIPVAVVFNGSTQAVMMATPQDLTDFAYGFALTEGIAQPHEIESIEPVAVPGGIDLRIWLQPGPADRLAQRRRSMIGPVGCGLCGIDSLEQALREPAPVALGGLRLTPDQVRAAIAALPSGQDLHNRTRAVHAAGWWTPAGLQAVREDVGRHNALDKLTGHVLRHGDASKGVVVITSRVSIDLVQKVAALGAGMLIAVSAPTAAAVEMAERLGLTLIALARAERFEVFSHPDRILT